MDAAAPMMVCLGHASRAGTIPVSSSDSIDRFEPRQQARRYGSALVDRTSLEVVGFIFTGVTAVVIVIAVLVVRSHVDAKNAAERNRPVLPAPVSVLR